LKAPSANTTKVSIEALEALFSLAKLVVIWEKKKNANGEKRNWHHLNY
jgi:hypothetical protein